jgi:hypothetical protein
MTDHHNYFFGGQSSLLADIRDRLERIETLLLNMDQKETAFMTTTDDAIATLTADVANLTTVDASATAMISGFAAQLAAAVAAAQAAGATSAQLQALTDLHTGIVSATTPLASAVAANTPAATP